MKVAAGAGYSGTPLWRKLGLRPEMHVALLNAPAGFEGLLEPLPAGVSLRNEVKHGEPLELAVLFVTSRADLVAGIGPAVGSLPADGSCWVAWPKRASKVSTDITEHVVREVVLPLGWVDIKVCAIDATWSGLRLVLRRELRGER